MKDKSKTKTQLIDELEKLRQRVSDIEKHDIDQAKDAFSIVYDAIDSTVAGIIITDQEGRITYVNPSFLRLFGYTGASELLGKNATQLFPGDEVKRFCDLTTILDISGGQTGEFSVQDKNGEIFTVEISSSIVKNSGGSAVGLMASFIDITKRKQLEQEKENLILKLQDALNKIKTLRGLIPICAACKNIRDDKGYWHRVEEYVRDHSEAQFSHGICPDCSRKLYPDLYKGD